MKKNLEIIDLLIKDTIEGRLHWYDNKDHFYCKIYTEKGNTMVQTIFRLSEITEYKDDFNIDEYLIVLDIYLSKNKKNEIFCKRIKDEQTRLFELTNAVNHFKKQKPGNE